jgi:hypothetical protein
MLFEAPGFPLATRGDSGIEDVARVCAVVFEVFSLG